MIERDMSITTFLTRTCKQTAVYWGNPTPDGYGGWTFDDPVEIACRWEDTNEVISTLNAQEIVCKAVVYVLQDLEVDGWLFLGELTDLDSEAETEPQTMDGAFAVRRFDKIPALGSTSEFLRKAYV